MKKILFNPTEYKLLKSQGYIKNDYFCGYKVFVTQFEEPTKLEKEEIKNENSI